MKRYVTLERAAASEPSRPQSLRPRRPGSSPSSPRRTGDVRRDDHVVESAATDRRPASASASKTGSRAVRRRGGRGRASSASAASSTSAPLRRMLIQPHGSRTASSMNDGPASISRSKVSAVDAAGAATRRRLPEQGVERAKRSGRQASGHAGSRLANSTRRADRSEHRRQACGGPRRVADEADRPIPPLRRSDPGPRRPASHRSPLRSESTAVEVRDACAGRRAQEQQRHLRDGLRVRATACSADRHAAAAGPHRGRSCCHCADAAEPGPGAVPRCASRNRWRLTRVEEVPARPSISARARRGPPPGRSRLRQALRAGDSSLTHPPQTRARRATVNGVVVSAMAMLSGGVNARIPAR